MSIETLALMKKGANFNQLFTSKITLKITEKNGNYELNFNKGVAKIILPTRNLLRLVNGGRKKRKTKRKTIKKKKRSLKNNKKNKRNKRKTKSKRNSKRKTIKKIIQKGGGLKTIILLILFNLFMFNYIVSIQFVKNPQNYLTSEQDFSENNPIVDPRFGGQIQNLLNSVQSIEIKNMTKKSTSEILQLVDMDGTRLNNDNEINTLDNYDTAFVEVQYGKNSPTRKLVELSSMLPHIERPTVSVGAMGLNSRARSYNLMARWEIQGENMNINLFNMTNNEGKFPDDRGRNFPDDPRLNELAKQTIRQQITTMKDTHMLKPSENSGYVDIAAVSFPIQPSVFPKKHLFHQDGLPWFVQKNKSEEEILQHNIDRSVGKPMFKNTTMGRNDIFGSILTMQYPVGTNIEAGNQIHYKDDDGSIKTHPIEVKTGEATTKILDQSKGAQHSARIDALYNLPKSRSAVLIFVTPDTVGKELSKNITLTPRGESERGEGVKGETKS